MSLRFTFKSGRKYARAGDLGPLPEVKEELENHEGGKSDKVDKYKGLQDYPRSRPSSCEWLRGGQKGIKGWDDRRPSTLTKSGGLRNLRGEAESKTESHLGKEERVRNSTGDGKLSDAVSAEGNDSGAKESGRHHLGGEITSKSDGDIQGGQNGPTTGGLPRIRKRDHLAENTLRQAFARDQLDIEKHPEHDKRVEETLESDPPYITDKWGGDWVLLGRNKNGRRRYRRAPNYDEGRKGDAKYEALNRVADRADGKDPVGALGWDAYKYDEILVEGGRLTRQRASEIEAWKIQHEWDSE